MKVLHILDHSLPLFSGYSFRSANIVKFQKLLGIEPVVLTSPKQGTAPAAVEEIENIRYYRTPMQDTGTASRLPFVKEARLMRRLGRRMEEVIEREKVELIHSHSPSLNGLPALRAARRHDLPFIYEARAFWEDAAVDHGTFGESSLKYRISRAVESYIFKNADAVFVIAEAMRGELAGRGIDANSVTVIPNGVDIERFIPLPRNLELARKFGLNGGPVFGFAGSFYHYEGLELLLQSFPKIVAQVPTARLLLIGGGPEDATLRRLAGRLEPAAIFTGHVPHSEVPDYSSLIDVFVFPRRKMRLTDLVTPLKPLEAMAMAKTVLASDVGGHRELIQHGVTGLMFRADDTGALVAEAVKLATDPELRDRLGKAGRGHVESKRRWAEIISNYRDIYNQLLH